MEVNTSNVSLNPNIEMKQSVKTQQKKVDLSAPEDKVELKSKSKTKTGAKIGGLAGLGYGAAGLFMTRNIFKEAIKIADNSKNKAAIVAGLALGLILDCGIGAGIGAGIGKIADCFSNKSDK